MNEWGVAIGNEAVWSREEEERENGLLGMDLVRLGLERSKTAYEALHVITDLLETFGQGGNASVTMDFRYHNSFLIADTCEAWILDTVNRRWVARRVKNAEGISNCYSTGEHWDEDSGDIQEHAYEMGYADRGQTFDFARAYGAVNLKLRAAYPRYKRLNQLLDRKKGILTPDYMGSILRTILKAKSLSPAGVPQMESWHLSACTIWMNPPAKPLPVPWWNCQRIKRLSGGAVCPIPVSRFSCLLPWKPPFLRRCPRAAPGTAMIPIWWKLERLSYELEEDYPRNTALWNPVKERLQEYICSLAEKGPDDSLLCEMASRLEEAADEMYLVLRDANASSSQPQRRAVLRAARTMAGII